MALDPKKLIFIDCQTTGMHPSLGHLLEIAWVLPDGTTRSFLLKLPEGEEIPARVQDITTIRDEQMSEAVDPEIAISALETDLDEVGEKALLVAHYAQFERAFLEAWWEERRGKAELPVRLVCSYRIAKKLFPQVPSRNIRALMGYFELGSGEVRRAAEHAEATAKIWRRLEEELQKEGLASLEEIDLWLEQRKKREPVKYEYRLDRLKRLELPDRPGVYRMLSKEGKVLYVGKATSLKSRVNSYFRGQKGRDRKKLEMLAQVWNIDVTECGSPLEAALLENEEIKRLDPPYNVSLRAGRRKLVFYSRDLLEVSLHQDELHPVGPFSLSNAMELIASWVKGNQKGEPAQIFYQEVAPETLLAGQKIFFEAHGLNSETASARQLLALGLLRYREEQRLAALEQEEPVEEEEATEEEAKEEQELPPEPEEVAAWYEGLLYRAASEYVRAKRLTRLLNSEVEAGSGTQAIHVRGGRVWHIGETLVDQRAFPWDGLDLVDYDRMSVLLAEINRHDYRVTPL